MTKTVKGYKFYKMKNGMFSVTAPNGENKKLTEQHNVIKLNNFFINIQKD